MVYEIQRYCIHDGEGIRSVVFFKGCQLKCGWCANPESQKREKEIGYFERRCKQCGICAQRCKNNAWSGQQLDRASCSLCGDCEYFCSQYAIKLYGHDVDAIQLADQLCADAAFYAKSGGGVTASGGEPTMQMELLTTLFRILKERGIHTALESHGYFSKDVREQIVPLTDQFLIDLKHLDAEAHQRAVGVPNDIILDNLRALAAYDLTVRIPLIPGFNDDDVQIERMAEFVKELDVPVHLLRFHNMAGAKYASLDREYTYAKVLPQTDERMQQILSKFKDIGVRAQIGG